MNLTKTEEKLNDKKNFGLLQQFDNLIIFAASGNTKKAGLFAEADFNEVAPTIVKAFQAQPELRELFRKCINVSQGIITV